MLGGFNASKAGNGIYNRIGHGIPDVAALGQNIALFNEGEFVLEGGTSASSPIFASIITRINDARLNVGKKVRFIAIIALLRYSLGPIGTSPHLPHHLAPLGTKKANSMFFNPARRLRQPSPLRPPLRPQRYHKWHQPGKQALSQHFQTFPVWSFMSCPILSQ